MHLSTKMDSNLSLPILLIHDDTMDLGRSLPPMYRHALPYLATFSMVALVAKSLRKLTRSPRSNTIHIGFVFVSQLKDKLFSKDVADAESLVATVPYFQ